MNKVIIIGGGITGLSAAYYLQKEFAAQGLFPQLQLIEQAPACGGKLQTMEKDGFVIEKGPDSFLARKQAIMDLTMELALQDELVGMNPDAKKTYIVRNGRLHSFPQGLMLGIPTAFLPFIQSNLISFRGKLRAAFDFILPRNMNHQDESLGLFLQKRFGQEVLDYLVEPIVAGIYAGNAKELSLQATFPQFQTLVRRYRSLMIGMKQEKSKTAALSQALPQHLRGSVFISYKKGLTTLTNALLQALNNVDIRTQASVTRMYHHDHQVCLELANGHQEVADAVIVTVPAHHIASMVEHSVISSMLDQIPYVSVANVILAYEKKDITVPLEGAGFVVPRVEHRSITACTWTSQKWMHTAPQDKVLLRCYVGRSGDEQWMQCSDIELVHRVKQDIADLMGIHATPLFYEITRMPRSMPQYRVGHLDLVTQVRQQLAIDLPGVWMTGAGFHGVGIPDCIQQGKEAAQQVVAYFQHSTKRG